MPYFATAHDDAVLLQEFAESVGRTVVQEECRQWARLGFDRGFEICADPEGVVRAWWPLVLDDIRDTAGAEWFTAFEIVDEPGEKQIVTQAGGIGIHPEERLWGRLRAAGVAPEQVLRIHCGWTGSGPDGVFEVERCGHRGPAGPAPAGASSAGM